MAVCVNRGICGFGGFGRLARKAAGKVKLLLRDAGLPEEFTLKGIRPVTPKELSPEEQAAAEKEAIAEVLKSLNRRGGF